MVTIEVLWILIFLRNMQRILFMRNCCLPQHGHGPLRAFRSPASEEGVGLAAHLNDNGRRSLRAGGHTLGRQPPQRVGQILDRRSKNSIENSMATIEVLWILIFLRNMQRILFMRNCFRNREDHLVEDP